MESVSTLELHFVQVSGTSIINNEATCSLLHRRNLILDASNHRLGILTTGPSSRTCSDESSERSKASSKCCPVLVPTETSARVCWPALLPLPIPLIRGFSWHRSHHPSLPDMSMLYIGFSCSFDTRRYGGRYRRSTYVIRM